MRTIADETSSRQLLASVEVVAVVEPVDQVEVEYDHQMQRETARTAQQELNVVLAPHSPDLVSKADDLQPELVEGHSLKADHVHE